MTSGVVDHVLAAVSGAVDAALGLETWRLGSADVVALVEGLAVEASRLGAAGLRVLAEAEEQRVGVPGGFLSTAAWYGSTTRSRARDAVPAVALATALTGPLSVTAAALAEGSLSVAHAAVVHRVMTKVAAALEPSLVDRTDDPALSPDDVAATTAGAEAFLVEHATRLDPDQLAVAGRHLVARLTGHRDVRGAESAEDRALARAGLTHVQLDDGSWYLRATLDAVGGAVLAAALDAESAPAAAGADGSRDPRTASQRRAAALVHIADTHLAGPPGGTRTRTRTRPRVTVTVDVVTLADPWAFGAAPGELTVPGCGDAHGGHPLSPSALSALVCDADLVPVLFGPDGAPLDVGRTVYAFPEKVRAAITARDRGCTFPHACGRPPAWCQVHHLVPFSRGGSTSERSGALVCTPAHLVIHREGWAARLVGDQVLWTPPDRAARARDGAQAVEISSPPPWGPGLDQVIDGWRRRLAQQPLHDTG